MPGNLLVELKPATPKIDHTGGAVDLTVVVQNKGDVIDQYLVEITGLDSGWYTSPGEISLFPAETTEVDINVHPNGSGATRGSYPFSVRVRSRGGAVEESVSGVLEVGGKGRLQLAFARDSQTGHRQGDFRLKLSNDGSADVETQLEAIDAEAACDIRFAHGSRVLVAATGSTDVQVRVRPRKRPWVGQDKAYSFSVTARPLSGGAEPKTVPGTFTHRPWLRSWEPLKLVAITLVAAGVILVIGAILISAGVLEQFPRRAEIAFNVVRGTVCRVPAVSARCPVEAFAAIPQLDPKCEYEPPFKAYFDAETGLIGPCISRVAYDQFGNGLQYSRSGVLFWLKESNTVYFFTGRNVHAFLQGKSQQLR